MFCSLHIGWSPGPRQHRLQTACKKLAANHSKSARSRRSGGALAGRLGALLGSRTLAWLVRFEAEAHPDGGEPSSVRGDKTRRNFVNFS